MKIDKKKGKSKRLMLVLASRLPIKTNYSTSKSFLVGNAGKGACGSVWYQ
jgi:hypothetical protein